MVTLFWVVLGISLAVCITGLLLMKEYNYLVDSSSNEWMWHGVAECLAIISWIGIACTILTAIFHREDPYGFYIMVELLLAAFVAFLSVMIIVAIRDMHHGEKSLYYIPRV